MAAQKGSKQKQKAKMEKKEPRFGDTMLDEVILIIIVVVSFVVLISLLTKKMGILGGALGDGLRGLLGISSILLPLSVVAYCCWLLASQAKENREVRIGGAALFLISVSALAHVLHPIEVSVMSSLADTLKAYYQEGAFYNGGFIGGILGGGLSRAFGKIGSGIIWSAVLLISLIMATGKSFFKGVSSVNAYQKTKRKQYQENRQKNETVRHYIQEVPKKAARPPKVQQSPQPKLQSKQNIKKKQYKKSDFNILLHADEGYNQQKQEVPLVEATVFKPKKEQETLLEPMPKTPIIFDYGKTEGEILAEQQQMLTAEQEFALQQNVPQTKRNSGKESRIQPEKAIYHGSEEAVRESRQKHGSEEAVRESRQKHGSEEAVRESRQKHGSEEVERENKQKYGLKEAAMENKLQQATKEAGAESKEEQTAEAQITETQQNTAEQTNGSIRYMIFQEGEEPFLEEEEAQAAKEQEQTEKSDTEDIKDVLELLNSIQFEEETEENPQEETEQDIMDIIADWAEEEEEDLPQSNGLTLLFAEETEQQSHFSQEEADTEAHDTLKEEKADSEYDDALEEGAVLEEYGDFHEKAASEYDDVLEEGAALEAYGDLDKAASEYDDALEGKADTEAYDALEEEKTDTEYDNTLEEKRVPQQEEYTKQTEGSLENRPIEQPQKNMLQKEKMSLENKKPSPVIKQQRPYTFPPLDLLTKNQAMQSSDSKAEMLVNAKKLENTLRSFGVEAKVIQINKGPTVTRYELSPSQGVKVSKIVNLADDIALNLAASDIRIEAPIPGKAAVGIEVPNKEAQSVYLRSVLESEAFQKFPSKLAFALGEDIAGQPIVADIAKMPHLLIAGATGSGKSVCINTLITSILYKADPKEVKLLLVDPKVVELSVYNGIPHLLIPVVTDPKKASAALNWAVREMLERYNDFAENGVRDIKGYNAMKREQGEAEGIMPQIVIIIDELADLMMAAPGEVEDAICRLAQMARAAGMHLIIATQRPSVDVITGVIKANIPSRLAFAVSSGIDSRTILDAVGAEKLLGKGDMLFCPQGTSKPMRIQGAFLSDKEVESIVSFVKQYEVTDYDKEMIDKITAVAKTGGGEEETDEFFDQAVDLVVEKEKASVSMLQRQFRIGYNRAARLMASLEQQGIVGPEEGSKPRKVLLTKQEWADMRE